MFQKSPHTVGRILAALSQRLWFTFIRLRAKVYENPLTRTYVLLENKLLEERISLSSDKALHPRAGHRGDPRHGGRPRRPGGRGERTSSPATRTSAFQFRQVTIESPSALEAKARYFRTRDHLGSPELKGEGRKRTPPRIGLDMHELRVPPDKIP